MSITINIKNRYLPSSIVNPENEKYFNYITSFFPYIPITTLCPKDNVQYLLSTEQNLISELKNGKDKFNAWRSYLSWVETALNDPLRAYLALEYFTKDTVLDEALYMNKGFFKLWMNYINMNKDSIDMLISMQRKGICSKNPYLYESLSVLYEMEHDFITANKIFQSAMNVNGVKLDVIKQKYEEFLKRILKRINREIEQTVIDYNIIEKHIRNEIDNSERPIYSKGNKRLLNKNIVIYLNFTMSKKGIEIKEKDFNIIERGNECVELYKILVDYLYKNDDMYKRIEDEHKDKLRKLEEKKPYSWFDSRKRVVKEKEKITISEFNPIEKKHNDLLTNESYLMTPDKAYKESKYNEITLRKPLSSIIYGSEFMKGKKDEEQIEYMKVNHLTDEEMKEIFK